MVAAVIIDDNTNNNNNLRDVLMQIRRRLVEPVMRTIEVKVLGMKVILQQLVQVGVGTIYSSRTRKCEPVV